MELQNLNNDFNCCTGVLQEMNFLAPTIVERDATKSQMGFKISSCLMEQSHKCFSFEPLGNRGAMKKASAAADCDDGKNGFSLGVEKKGLSLNLSNGEDEISNNGKTKLCARGHWRPAEDAKLKDLVAQYGPQNWNLIADHLEGRSGKSCRLRWFNQLDPRINRRAFTEEEEETLLAAHRLHGNKWAMISRLFHGRTDNAVKNHWHVIMARKYREKSSIYSRGKKPSSSSSSATQQPLHKGLDLIVETNALSDQSTISSNIDEYASTCTHLSLTPSSAKVHHQMDMLSNYSFFGTACNRFYKKGLMGMTMGTVDQSANSSDSNSDVSAAESVGTNIIITNNSISRESDGNEKIINVTFIDFLGVGAS